MRIKNIVVRNFKSLYGEHSFDFSELDGLIKLSGVIGSGKTSLGESILYGLYGNVKDQVNNGLISWNMKACEVEMNIISKNKEIYIKRNTSEPLYITVDGRVLAASNKRDTQQILEEELFDVPKLAVQKMCIISFNAFNNSLAAMNPGETRQFLDEIFGFKLFTDYNNEIVIERKNKLNESTRLHAIYDDTEQQIQYLIEKKDTQKEELRSNVDIDKLNTDREALVNQGVALKNDYTKKDAEYKAKSKEYDNMKLDYYTQKMEYATLGKQEKEWVNTFKSGKCPTCGHDIDPEKITMRKDKMLEYATKYKEAETKEKEYAKKKMDNENERENVLSELTDKMNDLKKQIREIDSQVTIYDNNLKVINENYDDLISEAQSKLESVKKELDSCDLEVGEWNEMNELFTKTLRYNLLETLIPHINKSIKYYINKLDQSFKIEYDQEFKPHIYVDTFEKEIRYNNLSTGQKKSLDMAIIFGVLQNIIANVDFNIFFLDELFSNLDADARNIMLSLLKESLANNRSIFVINHAEMNDDFFNHKLRVNLENKKVQSKKKNEVIVKSSKYTKIF